MRNRLLAIAQAVLIALVILAGAIAAPVLCRPFFYLHIDPLNLPAQTGLSTEQIKTAYREMMDFCIGISDTFSVGVLPFSESGASHFADVRRLFVLDLWALAVSTVLLVMTLLFQKNKMVRFAGHTPGFWSAVGLGVSFVTVGGLATVDFDRAFTVFHKLFFPGKDNWLFDTRTDPVIRMLPAEFFRNCAILILVLILISCVALIIWDRKRK